MNSWMPGRTTSPETRTFETASSSGTFTGSAVCGVRSCVVIPPWSQCQRLATMATSKIRIATRTLVSRFIADEAGLRLRRLGALLGIGKSPDSKEEASSVTKYWAAKLCSVGLCFDILRSPLLGCADSVPDVDFVPDFSCLQLNSRSAADYPNCQRNLSVPMRFKRHQ